MCNFSQRSVTYICVRVLHDVIITKIMKNKIILKEKKTHDQEHCCGWSLTWPATTTTSDGYNMIILLLLFVAVTSFFFSLDIIMLYYFIRIFLYLILIFSSSYTYMTQLAQTNVKFQINSCFCILSDEEIVT